MSQHVLVPIDDGVGLALPADVLAALGLQAGDLVELTINDRQVLLSPVSAASQPIHSESLPELLTRRKALYQHLN
jgi:antitoxin component of MazEF toxin-antitoxin module